MTGGSWPPTDPKDARRFVERCSWHGLLPLLFSEVDLPPLLERARSDVAGWRRILEVRARLFDEAVEALCSVMGDEPFVVMKGADYAQRLYPSSFLRPMQDIDIFVPSERIDAVCDRLAAAGLVRQPAFGEARDPGYMERVFFLGKILVEVHQSFIQVQRHSIDYEGVWRRRLPIEVGGHRAFRLDDVDALAYHALTMSVDEFQVRLVRYVDLWLLLRQREGTAVAAAARAREWSSVRALYGALTLACRLIPETRTADVASALDDVLAPSTRRFLDRWVLPRDAEIGRIEPLPRARQLWRKALLMDSPRHRLSFAISHAEATIRGLRSG